MGEAWSELYYDLQYLQSSIIGLDRRTLDIMLRKVREWSLHLRTLQETVLKKQKYEERKEEVTLFAFIKDSNLIEALDALTELVDMGRITENMFRYMRKIKQRCYLQDLDKFTNALAEYHHTFMIDVNVSSVFNQKIKLESNEIIDPFGKPFDLELVSPRDEIIETLEPTCDNSMSNSSLGSFKHED